MHGLLSAADAVADGFDDDFDSEGCFNNSVVTMMNEYLPQQMFQLRLCLHTNQN